MIIYARTVTDVVSTQCTYYWNSECWRNRRQVALAELLLGCKNRNHVFRYSTSSMNKHYCCWDTIMNIGFLQLLNSLPIWKTFITFSPIYVWKEMAKRTQFSET